MGVGPQHCGMYGYGMGIGMLTGYVYGYGGYMFCCGHCGCGGWYACGCVIGNDFGGGGGGGVG